MAEEKDPVVNVRSQRHLGKSRAEREINKVNVTSKWNPIQERKRRDCGQKRPRERSKRGGAEKESRGYTAEMSGPYRNEKLWT